MTLEDGTVYGKDPGRAVCRTVSEDRVINTSLYKKSEIADVFNEMSLRFRDFELVFRAYDEGVAYRFVSRSKKPFNVVSEEAVFNFAGDSNAYVPYVRKPAGKSFDVQFSNSFENTYEYISLYDETQTDPAAEDL